MPSAPAAASAREASTGRLSTARLRRKPTPLVEVGEPFPSLGAALGTLLGDATQAAQVPRPLPRATAELRAHVRRLVSSYYAVELRRYLLARDSDTREVIERGRDLVEIALPDGISLEEETPERRDFFHAIRGSGYFLDGPSGRASAGPSSSTALPPPAPMPPPGGAIGSSSSAADGGVEGAPAAAAGTAAAGGVSADEIDLEIEGASQPRASSAASSAFSALSEAGFMSKRVRDEARDEAQGKGTVGSCRSEDMKE